MNLISIPGNPLRGAALPPGDKSLSHRAALLSALAQGETCVDNFLVAGVTRAMLNALTDLGVAWELSGNELRVQGQGLSGLRSPDQPIDCGNSATTLRLLAGALAAAGVSASLDGSAGLRRRPMGRIVEPLQAMGVPIEATEAGTAPLRLAARPVSKPLKPIHYTLPVASAQVKSCLLLAALASEGPVTLHEPGPSRDHTERMLRSMGVLVESEERTLGSHFSPVISTTISPMQSGDLKPLQLKIPGDMSAAAFLIVASLITPGSEVILRGVGLNSTRTGLVDALQAMGADLQVSGQTEINGEPMGDLTVRYSPMHGIHISGPLVVRMIDEFPAFAVAAVFAEGQTIVSEAAELRHKESDRISAVCQELRSLGAQIEETADGFIVHGGSPLHGGKVQSHGDHRLAMALVVAGLAGQERIVVEGAEIVAESFPGFESVLTDLGANLHHEP